MDNLNMKKLNEVDDVNEVKNTEIGTDNENEKSEDKVVLMKVDFAFKYVMRNEKVVKGFLAAVLNVKEEDIEKVSYLDTNTEKDSESGKLGILDLLVCMNGNVKVNIEIQLTMEKYWSNRIMFYLCEEYTTGYRKGEGYDDVNIPKVVNISLLDVDYLKDEERVYNNFKIMNTRSGRVLTDKMDIHIIELSKLDRVTAEEEAEHKDILKWARFISAASWSEYEKYGKEDGAMAEAVKELRKINADEIERLRYLHREIAIRDEQQRKIDEERSKKEAEKIKKESEEIKKESEEIKKESEEIKKESEEIKKKSEEMKKESEKAIKIIEETERKLEEEKKKRKEMEEEYNKMKEMYEAMLQNQK